MPGAETPYQGFSQANIDELNANPGNISDLSLDHPIVQAAAAENSGLKDLIVRFSRFLSQNATIKDVTGASSLVAQYIRDHATRKLRAVESLSKSNPVKAAQLRSQIDAQLNWELYSEQFRAEVEQVRTDAEGYLRAMFLGPWDKLIAGEVDMQQEGTAAGKQTVNTILSGLVGNVINFVRLADGELSAENEDLVRDYVNGINANLWNVLSTLGDYATHNKINLELAGKDRNLVTEIDTFFAKDELQNIGGMPGVGFQLVRPAGVNA